MTSGTLLRERLNQIVGATERAHHEGTSGWHYFASWG